MRRAWLPSLLLVGYGVAFAWNALAGGLLVFDDHPGQMYRVAHVLTVGFAPWRLNPGWWAGYAELQFYPPGASYVGAAIHYVSLMNLDLAASYELLLWITFLLPGVTTYLFLMRTLGSAWLALPGGFLALTLSGGSRSGVEEGLRWGLIAARLGWGLLPLLALALHRWTEGRRPSLGAPCLLAAIILTHPAHAPAAIAFVLLAAWYGLGSLQKRLGQVIMLTGIGIGLAAFWLIPLLAHLDLALPLAWGEPTLTSLSRRLADQPLLLVLIGASMLAWRLARRPGSPVSSGRWLTDLPLITALGIVLDAIVVQRLGFYSLPADRLMDSLFLALIISASVAVAWLARRWSGLPEWTFALTAIALCVGLSSWGRPDAALSLWPHGWPNEWPKYDVVTRGMRVEELWEALAKTPPGRALFVRSGLPLEPRPDWRRPHSHVTAITPLHTGRGILNGTFTHPSPIAGLVYTGSPAHRPLTLLVEQRDGVTLFGGRMADLDARRFNELAERLRVSSVVALDEDQGQLGFLAGNPAFSGPSRVGPFLVFVSRAPRHIPAETGTQQWRLSVPARRAGWMQTGMAYSPLWQGRVDGRAVPLRRDELGLLEVDLPAGAPVVVDLRHRPGAVELTGLAVSAVSVLALGLVWIRRLRRADRS